MTSQAAFIVVLDVDYTIPQESYDLGQAADFILSLILFA
jgi:hypothetical protein